MIDTLDEGGTIEDLLDGWPNVPREYAEAFIHWQQNQSQQLFGLDLAGQCGSFLTITSSYFLAELNQAQTQTSIQK
ncbi:MAG TPA: hypothetical protein VGL56_00150 [Fimbriimonadaceae bacterium]